MISSIVFGGVSEGFEAGESFFLSDVSSIFLGSSTFLISSFFGSSFFGSSFFGSSFFGSMGFLSSTLGASTFLASSDFLASATGADHQTPKNPMRFSFI
ncbi:MAG: hypothetical protein WCI00_09780 [bacterium]